MSAQLTYALYKDNKSVHVDAVKKGNACGCICPYCKQPLCAKNSGTQREHHFAHPHGYICEGANETMLHVLAKEVLAEECCIKLPATGGDLFPSGLVELHDVKVEQRDEQFGIIPDAEGILPNGERLLIEFYFSHKITDQKRQIILQNQLKCIEIDLNWVPLNKQSIRTFLLESNDNRKWITESENKVFGKEFGGGSYTRNPLHLQARDYMKKIFDTETLLIAPFGINYDLKKIGYDVCDMTSKMIKGIKPDLVLYRSKKEKYEEKGYIFICFRGRRRNYNKEIPSGIKVIDIFIREKDDYDCLLNWDCLNVAYGVEFYGFENKSAVIDNNRSVNNAVLRPITYLNIEIDSFNEVEKTNEAAVTLSNAVFDPKDLSPDDELERTSFMQNWKHQNLLK